MKVHLQATFRQALQKELQYETRASLVAILIGSNSSLSYKRASPSTQIPAARAYRARTRQRVFTRIVSYGTFTLPKLIFFVFYLFLVSFCLVGEAYTTTQCPTDLHSNGNTITYKFIQLSPAVSPGRSATYIACTIVLDTDVASVNSKRVRSRKTGDRALTKSFILEKCSNCVIA